MKCYYCTNTLTNSNKSKEHIILDALEGRLFSYSLLCEPCNNDLGNTIDAELFKQIGFIADLLDVKRDRKKSNANRGAKMIDENNEIVYVDSSLNLKPTFTFPKGRSGDTMTLFASDESDLKRVANKKAKEFERAYGRKPNPTYVGLSLW